MLSCYNFYIVYFYQCVISDKKAWHLLGSKVRWYPGSEHHMVPGTAGSVVRILFSRSVVLPMGGQLPRDTLRLGQYSSSCWRIYQPWPPRIHRCSCRSLVLLYCMRHKHTIIHKFFFINIYFSFHFSTCRDVFLFFFDLINLFFILLRLCNEKFLHHC